MKKPGQWNRMTVWCLGPKVDVLLNGELVTQIDMTQWTSTSKTPDGRDLSPRLNLPLAGLPTKGHIGLQGKHGSSDVLFRNVRIKINLQTTVSSSSSTSYETNTILNSFHPSAINVLMADGSVRSVSETIDMETLRRLAAADDGEPIGEF